MRQPFEIGVDLGESAIDARELARDAVDRLDHTLLARAPARELGVLLGEPAHFVARFGSQCRGGVDRVERALDRAPRLGLSPLGDHALDRGQTGLLLLRALLRARGLRFDQPRAHLVRRELLLERAHLALERSAALLGDALPYCVDRRAFLLDRWRGCGGFCEPLLGFREHRGQLAAAQCEALALGLELALLALRERRVLLRTDLEHLELVERSVRGDLCGQRSLAAHDLGLDRRELRGCAARPVFVLGALRLPLRRVRLEARGLRAQVVELILLGSGDGFGPRQRQPLGTCGRGETDCGRQERDCADRGGRHAGSSHGAGLYRSTAL